jgi:predicted enzyme related to lactoylglutathione lyase
MLEEQRCWRESSTQPSSSATRTGRSTSTRTSSASSSGLTTRRPTGRGSGQAQPAQGRIPAAYTIETPDIRKAVDTLETRGVTFETEVLEYPFAYVAGFQDPDGNRLQLREGR